MGGEKFLVGLRGAKIFSIAFRIVFRILFQTVFRIDLNFFRGQICSATRAALTIAAEIITQFFFKTNSVAI